MDIKKNIIENIFSIKKNRYHKIIKIVGIKLSLRRKFSLQEFETYLNAFVDIRLAPKATGRLRKMQLLELYLMRELKKICEQLGVKFWLHGGTALGAYRHKGFIPWDDDVDLGMMREDFDKLTEYVNTYSNKFEIIAFYNVNTNTKVMKFAFKNVKGDVYVDIFPYDWCSYENHAALWKQWLKDKEELKEKIKKIHLKERAYSKDIPPDILKEIEEINDSYKNKYAHFKDRSAIISAIEQIGARKRKRIYSYDFMFPLRPILFEGEQYYVMNNLEDFLAGHYGKNYMNFPLGDNLECHSYMFKPENYGEIEELYKKYVINEG